MPIDNVYQVPIIGPWVGRVGHVIDIVATPCDVKPMIAVKAFWHSAPLLLASLYKPDPMDYLTERFDRPHKKGRKRRFRPAFTQGPANVVPKGKVGWAFFTGMQLVERVGWYILVVDATTQFAVNWTSMAYQWSGCKVPRAPYCRSEVATSTGFPIGAGEHIFSHWSVQSFNGFAGDANSIGTPKGYMTNVMLNFVTKPFTGPAPEASITGIQIRDAVTDKLVWRGEPQKNHLGQDVFSTLVKDDLPGEGAHDYYVVLEKTFGHFNAIGSTFMVYGSSDRGLDPDP